MARAGYESDKKRFMLRERASGAVSQLAAAWDASASQVVWCAADSRARAMGTRDVLTHTDLQGVRLQVADPHGSVARAARAVPTSHCTAAARHRCTAGCRLTAARQGVGATPTLLLNEGCARDAALDVPQNGSA